MDHTTVKTLVESPAPAAAPLGANQTTRRLFFIDHLRAAIVILVVLHHVGLVYGAAAPFYYAEPPFADPLGYLVLLIFALSNQAWFMGVLFLVAGYFTPASFERKGSASFLKGRLARLGIPLIAFFFLLNPLASIGYWQMPAELTGITTPLSWQVYPFLLGMGPLWFVALLLIFDFGYATWQKLTGNRAKSVGGEPALPGYLGVGVFIVALALLSYLVRIAIPMGKYVLGFPTLSYLPQYLALFVLGIVAYRGDWLRALPTSMGITGLAAAAIATILLFPLALSGSLLSLQILEPAGFVGNGTWQSAVYAFWDSTVAVGMCLGLTVLFRKVFDRQGWLGGFLSQHSYAVYVIHAPVVVFLAIALRGVHAAALAKFVLGSLLIVPACFLLATIIRGIPGVSRIL